MVDSDKIKKNGENKNIRVEGDYFEYIGDKAKVNILKKYFYQLTSRDDVTKRKNEIELLNRVKESWIEGVLKKSLYNEVLIELGLEPQINAVGPPKTLFNIEIEPVKPSDYNLLTDKKITDIFEDSKRALLVLGVPGSGKTTTLLNLTNQIAKCALTDPTESIPTVFNLSSWTDKRQRIDDWLIEELYNKYHISRRIGKKWVRDAECHPLLFILDGLDEVRPDLRFACVDAINNFRDEYGFTGVVVACREQEYHDIVKKLQLENAVRLKPLKPKQINDYLEEVGPKLATLRKAIDQDSTLQEMAQSPLMLSVMSLAYQDVPQEEMITNKNDSTEIHYKKLFSTYVKQMFKRRVSSQLYSSEKTMHWLNWLARNMVRYNLSEFHMEQLQPSWLSSRFQVWLYVFISRCISSSFIFLGSFFLLLGGTIYLSILSNNLLMGIKTVILYFFGLVIGGLIVGIGIGIIDCIRSEWSRNKEKSKSGFWWAVLNILIVTFVLILITGGEPNSRLGALYLPLVLIFGLRGRKQILRKDVYLNEGLRWAWKRFAIIFILLGVLPSTPFIFFNESEKENSLTIWDVVNGVKIRTMRGYFGNITCTTYSPDGEIIVLTSEDKVFLLRSSDLTTINVLKAKSDNIGSISFNPEGNILAGTGTATDSDPIIELWMLAENNRHNVLKGHSGAVRHICFAPDGKILASGGLNGTIKLWDTSDWSEINILRGNFLCGDDFCFSPNGKILASECKYYHFFQSKVILWNTLDWSIRGILDSDLKLIDKIDFSPNSEKITIVGKKGIEIWNSQSLKKVAYLNLDYFDSQTCISYGPNGKILASGGGFWGDINLWNASDLSEIGILEQEQEIGILEAISFSPDGKYLVGITSNFDTLRFMASFWLFSMLIFAIFISLRSKRIERMKTKPNQGIWLSLKRAILIGAGFVMITTLIIFIGFLSISPSIDWEASIPSALLGLGFGVLLGFIGISWFGAFDFIQHFTLRFILWRKGNIPWNYVRFLDYTTDRIFLRKVGGGYIFVHRMLMEYFASLK